MNFYKYLTSYLSSTSNFKLTLDKNNIYDNYSKYYLITQSKNSFDFTQNIVFTNLGDSSNKFNTLYSSDENLVLNIIGVSKTTKIALKDLVANWYLTDLSIETYMALVKNKIWYIYAKDNLLDFRFLTNTTDDSKINYNGTWNIQDANASNGSIVNLNATSFKIGTVAIKEDNITPSTSENALVFCSDNKILDLNFLSLNNYDYTTDITTKQKVLHLGELRIH